MRKQITHSKEREKKLKSTIAELRAENRKLLKENNLLKQEITKLTKSGPISKTDVKSTRSEPDREQWLKEFISKYKKVNL